MLMGEYRHAMDAKGRLFMPAKLREDLGDKFIATQGIDGQLFVFSFEEWTNFANKLRSLPMSDPGAQAFVRLFAVSYTHLAVHLALAPADGAVSVVHRRLAIEVLIVPIGGMDIAGLGSDAAVADGVHPVSYTHLLAPGKVRYPGW